MNILYTDEYMLVIDKPAGLPVLPDGWEPDAPYLLKLLEEENGKLWVVHRLDKVTSGVMLFARNAEAHRALSLQFEGHQVEKIYHALVNGQPKWKDHIARHPLRANVGHKHRTAVDNHSGKPAETEFKVLKRFSAQALLEARPHTGRTHQIRVHAYALGHPLVGDTLYSAPPTDWIERPALHAKTLQVTHPISGERLIFEAPYPEDFATALQRAEV
jgi:RluA family pseudouridine synthase